LNGRGAMVAAVLRLPLLRLLRLAYAAATSARGKLKHEATMSRVALRALFGHCHRVDPPQNHP